MEGEDNSNLQINFKYVLLTPLLHALKTARDSRAEFRG